MPTMPPETVGGISAGCTSYSRRVCVPPYSQHIDIANSYIIVQRPLAYYVNQLLYSYLVFHKASPKNNPLELMEVVIGNDNLVLPLNHHRIKKNISGSTTR